MLLSVMISSVFGQVCRSDDIDPGDFQFGLYRVTEGETLDIDFVGTIVTYQMEFTRSITAKHNENSTIMYIDADFDPDSQILSIFSTNALANYESEKSSDSIVLILTFECFEQSQSLTINQLITEANNHAPYFSQSVYEIEIMLPLPGDFDLAIFQKPDEKIYARDLDLRNNEVIFSSPDSEMINVGTSTDVSEDGKSFYATMFTSQQLLTINDRFEFTIIATDIGNPPRSAEARVVLIGSDIYAFIPIPRFDKPVYRGSLSDNRELILEHIFVNNDTFSNEIAFGFSEGDAELFSFSNVMNEIIITLSSDLSDEDLEGKLYLITTFVANRPNVDQGSTIIIVDIPTTTLPPIPVPAFELSTYRGSLDENRELVLDPIVLIASTYDDNVSFVLEGGDSALFQFANESNIITVSLAGLLTSEDVDGRAFLITSIIANRPDVGSGFAFINIDVPPPVIEPEIPIPAFEQNVFRGLIDENRVLTFEDVIVNASTYSNDLTFECIGGDAALFTPSNVENIVTVSLTQDLTEEDIAGKLYLMTTLYANKADIGSGSTILLVNISVTTPQPPIAVPSFEYTMYRGSIDTDMNLVIDNILLVENTYNEAISFDMVGDDSNYFEISNVDHAISLTLKSDVTAEQLEGKDFLTFLIDALHPETTAGRTSVLISLPEKVCPVDNSPSFENSLYDFYIKSNTLGIFGSVLAKASTIEGVVISYRTDINDEYLSPRLTIIEDTGDLFLMQPLTPAVYYFRVIATGNSLEGYAEVRITVEAIVECPSISLNTTVEKSLAIRYLKENVQHSDILSMNIGDCKLNIVNEWPNDKKYVSINTDTNMLTSISFDREDPVFGNVEVPQIRVLLQLLCEDETIAPEDNISESVSENRNHISYIIPPVPKSINTIHPESPDGRWYVLTDEINYSADHTVLTIIIEDENDNFPIFVNPLSDAMFIGYPEASVAEQIMPPYLIKVSAIDNDAGLNAKIRYTLTDNAHFTINAESGVISPVRDAMKSVDEVVLIIQATDRDGAADANPPTNLQLNVRRLEINQITVITVQEHEVDDVQIILDSIFDNIGLDLVVMHSALISLGTNSVTRKYSEKQANGQINALRMFVYAVNDQNRFLSTDEVQVKLLEFHSGYDLSIVSYEDTRNNIIEEVPADPLILIIVCAVLGAALLILAIGTFFMWWRKIRPYEYRQMEDTGSLSSQQVLRSQGDIIAANSSPVLKINRFEVEKRESMEIRGTTVQETNDGDQPAKLVKSLSDLLENDAKINGSAITAGGNVDASVQSANGDAREPRRSQGVRFNEMVERIDIEVEPEVGRNNDSDDDQRL